MPPQSPSESTVSRIDIRFVSDKDMRPEAVGLGDWWFEGDTLQVRTQKGPDAFLIALHETVEAWLCKEAGITADAVDEFDNAWEREQHGGDDEPGDDERAPYRLQHRQAMIVEHLVAHFLGLTDYGTIR